MIILGDTMQTVEYQAILDNLDGSDEMIYVSDMALYNLLLESMVYCHIKFVYLVAGQFKKWNGEIIPYSERLLILQSARNNSYKNKLKDTLLAELESRYNLIYCEDISFS